METKTTISMPPQPTERMIDAALQSTAAYLNIAGSALTVNREKMRIRYRAMVAAWITEVLDDSKTAEPNTVTESDAWAKCPCQDRCRAAMSKPCLACWEDAGDIVAGLQLKKATNVE